MADAQSLFKKKGKKKFKAFNANNQQADALVKTVNESDEKTAVPANDSSKNGAAAAVKPGEDWGEIVSRPVVKSVVVGEGELGSMRSMAEIEKDRAAQDDLAERMRLADIKEQLEQAKSKVADNDAIKKAEDKEIADGWKKVEEKPKAAPVAAMGSGKYVPKFRREGGGAGGTSMGTGYQSSGAYGGGSSYGSRTSCATSGGVTPGGRFGRKADINDTSAFPTLGANGPAPTTAKPVVAGAWGSTAPAPTKPVETENAEGGESVFTFADKE